LKDGKAKVTLVSAEGRDQAAERLRKREDAALAGSGFEREEGTELWVKGGVCYGRNAALQHCQESGWRE
jgi:hypothetical protein